MDKLYVALGAFDDAGLQEGQKLLQAAGYAPNPKYEPPLEVEASTNMAVAMAGVKVRLPYFFLGADPEGKRWPRERAGGLRWLRKFLADPQKEDAPLEARIFGPDTRETADLMSWLDDAGYKIHDDSVVGDADGAAEGAAVLAGKKVRVPHVFLGTPPADGKPWPKMRHGSRQWLRNLLNAPHSRSEARRKAVQQPAEPEAASRAPAEMEAAAKRAEGTIKRLRTRVANLQSELSKAQEYVAHLEGNMVEVRREARAPLALALRKIEDRLGESLEGLGFSIPDARLTVVVVSGEDRSEMTYTHEDPRLTHYLNEIGSALNIAQMALGSGKFRTPQAVGRAEKPKDDG